MPRISQVDLVQVNNQIDRIDQLQAAVLKLTKQVSSTSQQAIVSDPTHAPQTTNNIVFTWTGGTLTLSWPAGYIKDKNWSVQTTVRPAAKSSAPGQVHMHPVGAGSLVLSASTFYWLGWDHIHNVMRATPDASTLHNNFNISIICQLFTGTGAQTGTAGGGGSRGGVDLSGQSYKNF